MEEKEKIVFIASVLLDEISFNKEKFLEDFVQDWGFDIREVDTPDEEIDEDENILISQIPGGFITVSLMPGPIPDNEVENNADRSNWDKAEEVAKNHKAHLLITTLSNEIPALELSTVFTNLVATSLKQEHATAVYALGNIYEPDFYTKVTQYASEEKIFPIPILIYFGIYSEDGKTINAYTYGLGQLNKQEIEILNSEKDPQEVHEFIMDITNYVASYDVTLKDGETIGFTEEQKLPITLSPAVATETKDGLSLKITF